MSAVGLVWAASPLRSQTSGPKSDPGLITGRVVDAGSLVGLPGVDVRLLGGTTSVVTNESGDFRLVVSVQGSVTVLLRKLGYNPVGMVYLGLRRDITFAGWMLAPHQPLVEQTCDAEVLQHVMDNARADSEYAVASIREGRIAPQPADEMKCDYCSVANACRYEVAAMQRLTTIEQTAKAAE